MSVGGRPREFHQRRHAVGGDRTSRAGTEAIDFRRQGPGPHNQWLRGVGTMVPVSIVVTREILNRSLANRQIFDWLDETLGLGRGSERPQAG
jgi:hypothetical protein